MTAEQFAALSDAEKTKTPAVAAQDAVAANVNGPVTVTVSNTGLRDGDETVQLYIHDLYSTSTRPVKELRAFKKVHIPAGQSADVTFTLTAEDLKYYDHRLEYVCEPGDFEIMVGPNSRDVQTVLLTVI